MATGVTDYGTTIRQYNPDPLMSLVSGVDCVADDILMRITTPQLWYDSNYGYDVNLLLNAAMNGPTAKQQVMAGIENQIKQDPRVSLCDINATFDGTSLTLRIDVTLIGGETFALIGSPISLLTTDQIVFAIAQGGSS